MPEKFVDFWIALGYIIVAIAGASGGCLVAAHHVMRGRTITAMLMLAYAFIGGVFAVAGMAAVVLLGWFDLSLERLLLVGMVFGAAGSMALAGANLSIRFILRRIGIEVDVQIKRIGSGDEASGDR